MLQHHFAKLVIDNLNIVCYVVDLESNDIIFTNNLADDERGKTFQSFFENHSRRGAYNTQEPCTPCSEASLILGKKYRKEIFDENSKIQFILLETIVEHEGKLAKICVISDCAYSEAYIDLGNKAIPLEETLITCIKTLVEDSEADSAVQALLKIVADYYGSDHAYVYEFNHKDNNVYKIHEWAADGFVSFFARNHPLPLTFFEPLRAYFDNHDEFVLKDIETELEHDSDLYQFFKLVKVNSILVVPFSIEGKETYCFGVDSPTKNFNNLELLRSIILFVVDKIRKNKMYQQLLQLSYSDSLTGVWNRNKYIQMIEDLESGRFDSMGYIQASVNGLKNINDLYGEKHGDIILKQTASLLKECTGFDVCRFNGNDFIAFCPNIALDDFEDILSTLRQRRAQEFELSISVGSIFQTAKIDIRKGIAHSYDIMYAEKQKFYKSKNTESTPIRSNAVQIILDEINSGFFVVYLQPKVDLRTEKITSAEALVRKIDQNGKKIPPDYFIPIYENEGTIRHIDFYVLEEVCIFLRSLIRQGKALKIAVNFSRVTFIEPNLVEEIVDICAKYEIPHSLIKIEITESIDKMDFDFFDKKLKNIKNAGFEIALDDFGARHSNLLMLTMTEFSEVKIDKGLIDHITQSAQNRALVRNILKMITDLGTSECVAEGIETKEQKDLILEFGCNYGQGFYFYQPMPFEEFLYEYEINHSSALLKNALEKNVKPNFALSYNEMSAIIDAMPFSVSLLTKASGVVSCNQNAIEIFGLETKEEFLRKFFALSPELQPNGENSLRLAHQHIENAYDTGYERFPWVHRTKQGKEFASEVTLVKLTVKGSEEAPVIAGFIREISTEIVDEEIREWLARYSFNNEVTEKALVTTILEISNDWLWAYNYRTREMMFFGDWYEKFDLPSDKFLFPETFLELKRVYEDDLDIFMRTCKNMVKGEHVTSDMRLYVPDGTVRYFRISYKIIKDKQGNLLTAIGKVEDVDEQKKYSTLFQVDDLTKCYNKVTTQVLIDDYIQAHENIGHTLFVLGIDQFKSINEKFGHTLGDSILKELVNDLYTFFRDEDVIGRVGGDEFLVFLKNTTHPNIVLEKKAIIENILTKSFCTSEHTMSMQGSVGMAIYPDNGRNFNSLFDYAEAELYRVKALKKSQKLET